MERKRKRKKKPSNRDPYNIKKLLASSHALHACDESYSFFFFFFFVKRKASLHTRSACDEASNF